MKEQRKRLRAEIDLSVLAIVHKYGKNGLTPFQIQGLLPELTPDAVNAAVARLARDGWLQPGEACARPSELPLPATVEDLYPDDIEMCDRCAFRVMAAKAIRKELRADQIASRIFGCLSFIMIVLTIIRIVRG